VEEDREVGRQEEKSIRRGERGGVQAHCVVQVYPRILYIEDSLSMIVDSKCHFDDGKTCSMPAITCSLFSSCQSS